MKIQFPIRKLEGFDFFAFFDDAFTSDECEKIKELFTDLHDGTIGFNGNTDDSIRKSMVKFVDPSEHTSWIFERFYQVAAGCNEARWKFQLSGFYEGIQLTQYDATGSHYDWHIDSGNGDFSIRKLSLVLLLDDPENYDGGELEFIGLKGLVKKKKGTLLVFPSYIGHKVHPVTGGLRRTAVAWISGEPYK